MTRRPPLPLTLTPLDKSTSSGGNGTTYRLREGGGYWRAKVDHNLQELDLSFYGALEAHRQEAMYRGRWIELERQVKTGRSNPALLQACAWPETIKSGPGPNGDPVTAIVMQDVTGAKHIDCFLDRKSRRKYFPAASDFDAVKLAHSLSQAVSVVHAAGYLVRDFQPMNAMVTPDFRAVLIDADSFARKDAPDLLRSDLVYFPYRAPELMDTQIGEGLANENHDHFALAQMLFAILMGEAHAFDAFLIDKTRDADVEEWIRQCKFPHSMRRPMREAIEFSHGCPPFSALPESIRNLFERAFAPEGKLGRPSATEWTAALHNWLAAGVYAWSMAPLPPPPPPAPVPRKAIPAPTIMQPPPVAPTPQKAAPPKPAAPQPPAAAVPPAKAPSQTKNKAIRQPIFSLQQKAMLTHAATLATDVARRTQEAITTMAWIGLLMAAVFILNSLHTSMTGKTFAQDVSAPPEINTPPSVPAISPKDAAWSALDANPTFRGMYEFHKSWRDSANDTPASYATLFATAAERNGVTGVGDEWRTVSDMTLYALPDESSDHIATIPAETTFTALGQMTYYGTWVIVSLKQFGPDGAWEYGFLHLTRSDDENDPGEARSSFADGV